MSAPVGRPARRRLLTILDGYVLGYFWSSYALCLLTLTLLFVIADAFANAKQFVNENTVWWRDIPLYYAGQLPILFDRFASFITLGGAMFAVARLERNNELMPMKAGGVSIFRALVPIFASAALLGGAQFLNGEVVVPAMADTIRAGARFQSDEAEGPGILRDARGNTLGAASFDRSRAQLRWVSFREHDIEGRVARAIFAERATWVPAGRAPPGSNDAARGKGAWLLEDGTIVEGDAGEQRRIGTGAPRDRAHPTAEEGLLLETSIRPIDIESLGERVSLLSFRDLRDQYRRQSYLPRLRVQLHARIATPLAHLVLCLLGLPFVLKGGGGRSVFLGMLALVVICAGFFVASFILQDLGSSGSISPFWAAWAPTVLFAVAGIWSFGEVRT
jgi:lipopolysaccharide export system permease protein